jgi:Methyltransferase domain
MHNYNVKNRENFIDNFIDRNFDPFKTEYLPDLKELLKIIQAQGENLEGNIFYRHHETNPTADLIPDFLPKRRALALLSVMNNNIMEIGFNAGFSALLLLHANKNLKLTCIDICHHKYTIPCFEYLKTRFNDRIELIQSDSLLAFPLLSRTGIEYDAYIIDGGHGVSLAEADLHNVISFGKRGSIICFDDSDDPKLRTMLNMHQLTGKLISISDSIGYIENLRQMFFVNNK